MSTAPSASSATTTPRSASRSASRPTSRVDGWTAPPASTSRHRPNVRSTDSGSASSAGASGDSAWASTSPASGLRSRAAASPTVRSSHSAARCPGVATGAVPSSAWRRNAAQTSSRSSIRSRQRAASPSPKAAATARNWAPRSAGRRSDDPSGSGCSAGGAAASSRPAALRTVTRCAPDFLNRSRQAAGSRRGPSSPQPSPSGAPPVTRVTSWPRRARRAAAAMADSVAPRTVSTRGSGQPLSSPSWRRRQRSSRRSMKSLA